MFQLVLFLLLLLSPIERAFAQKNKNTAIIEKNIVQNEFPFAIFLCEYCGKKNEKITTSYLKIYVNNFKYLKLFPSLSLGNQAKHIFERQQESEYQLFGTKTWPPKIPFALNPLHKQDGLIVFLNFSAFASVQFKPVYSSYVLIYKENIYMEKTEKGLEELLFVQDDNAIAKEGIRFFISREVPGDELSFIEESLKSMTPEKKTVLEPYEVNFVGVRYKSNVSSAHLIKAIKKINQTIPHLKAQIANGNNDCIEIKKLK